MPGLPLSNLTDVVLGGAALGDNQGILFYNAPAAANRPANDDLINYLATNEFFINQPNRDTLWTGTTVFQQLGFERAVLLRVACQMSTLIVTQTAAAPFPKWEEVGPVIDERFYMKSAFWCASSPETDPANAGQARPIGLFREGSGVGEILFENDSGGGAPGGVIAWGMNANLTVPGEDLSVPDAVRVMSSFVAVGLFQQIS